jgi:uncharacterized membrane protein
MLPGVLGITVFADSLVKTIQEPKPGQIVIFVLIAAVILAVMLGLKKWLGSADDDEVTDTP